MNLFWRSADNGFRSLDSFSCSQQPMPIIVGAPRSGTTLLRLMLDAHSELAIPPETGFLSAAEKLSAKGDKLHERFLDGIVNHAGPLSSWPDFEVSTTEFKAALDEIEPFNISDGYRAFYRLYAARHGKLRWGDKTPSYCHYLEAIRRVLPEARFIHIIRDGRDAALSLRRMWFSPGWEIETQAAYWRGCVLAARRAGCGRDDYLEVRYEDLVLNTRETLERICSHVDLTYEDEMLNYHKRAPERLKEHKGRLLPDGTTFLTQEQRFQQQQRTTTPPDPNCVFAWKRTMDGEEREKFAVVAGDLLRELGYEV
jgi:hypothetical protein